MNFSSILRASARVTVSTHCCRRVMYSTEFKNRFYTKKHEWVSVNDNIGTIGVSSFAQDALGEVVFAQLPDVGKVLSAGDECGALESVKAAGEVYTPVSGTLLLMDTAQNQSFEYEFRRGTSAAETARNVNAVFGEDTANSIRNGIFYLKNKPRGRPAIKVTEKNCAVESTPSLINKSCYEEGWLFKVKLTSREDLKHLMDQLAYDKYLQEAH